MLSWIKTRSVSYSSYWNYVRILALFIAPHQKHWQSPCIMYIVADAPYCRLTVMHRSAVTGCVRHRAVQWDWQRAGNVVPRRASDERPEAARQIPGKERVQVDSQEEEWLPEPPASSGPAQTSAVSAGVRKHTVPPPPFFFLTPVNASKVWVWKDLEETLIDTKW